MLVRDDRRDGDLGCDRKREDAVEIVGERASELLDVDGRFVEKIAGGLNTVGTVPVAFGNDGERRIDTGRVKPLVALITEKHRGRVGISARADLAGDVVLRDAIAHGLGASRRVGVACVGTCRKSV